MCFDTAASGYPKSMTLLGCWDKRNQRTMDWYRNHPEAGTDDYDERVEWATEAGYRRYRRPTVASILVPFLLLAAVELTAGLGYALVSAGFAAVVLMTLQARFRWNKSTKPEGDTGNR
jgi:hypothetical protein